MFTSVYNGAIEPDTAEPMSLSIHNISLLSHQGTGMASRVLPKCTLIIQAAVCMSISGRGQRTITTLLLISRSRALCVRAC